MIRTQVYLTKEQHDALHRSAQRSGVSVTEVLRRLIDRHLVAKGADPLPSLGAYFSFVGIGESGVHDVAERHDDYLAGALRGADVR